MAKAFEVVNKETGRTVGIFTELGSAKLSIHNSYRRVAKNYEVVEKELTNTGVRHVINENTNKWEVLNNGNHNHTA